MKDEIYPPPKPKPRPAPDHTLRRPSERNRRIYTALSLVFALLAFALNLSNNTNLISLKAVPNVLAAGTSEVRVKMRNMSAMTVYAARLYTLERLDGEQWTAVAGNAGEYDPPYFITTRFSSVDLTFGRYGVFEPLEPGEYRVALGFYAPSSFFGPNHSGTLYAAFTVEQDVTK